MWGVFGILTTLHLVLLLQSTNTQEEMEGTRSKGHSPMKGHTSESTLNFELTYDNGNINLLYKKKMVIDLSNPEKQVFKHSMTLKLKDNSLQITNSSDYIQKEYDGVQSLITFDGRRISERKRAMVRVHVSAGQLFVSKDKAFYSSSQGLNMLLNDQLARVIPRQSDTMLMFQTLLGGDLMLLIDGEPVVTLSGAEVKTVPVSNFILYTNGTIYVHNVIKQREDNEYARVNQFYVLNGILPGLEKCNKAVPKLLVPGGGHLYVHVDSGDAFYSRNRQINDAISEHINRLSEPSSHLVFAITFENNLNFEIPEVVLLVNGEEIFHLDATDTDDQSLTLKHSLKYTNETLFILEGSCNVAGAFIDVKELVVFDGLKIRVYNGSAIMLFAGGGQVFNSGFGAFYSMNANLNDQIGEALLTAKSAHTFPADYEYTSAIPNSSTVVPTTSATHFQTLTFTSTESEDHIIVNTEASQTVSDKSRITETSTHPKTRGTIVSKDESPRFIKTKDKIDPTRSSQREHNADG